MRMRKNRTILEREESHKEKMDEIAIKELLKSAKDRAEMECGMYRPYLPQNYV